MKFKIMIAIGKPGYLYEIWGEKVDATLPGHFTQHGYYATLEEAEESLSQLDCLHNGELVPDTRGWGWGWGL